MFVTFKENVQLTKYICHMVNQSSQWETGFDSKYRKTMRSQIFKEGYIVYSIKRNRTVKLFLGAGPLDVAGTQPELQIGP